jgi:hypothetical protein
MTRRSALKNTQSYLSLLNSEVRSSVLSGESRQDAIENIKLSAFNEDKLYDIWHHKNVASVYDEFTKKEKSKINPKSKIIATEDKKNIKKRIEVKKIVKKVIVKPKQKKSLNKIVTNVKYVSFSTAVKHAKAKNKIIFLKVRSTTCKYCDELDSVIANDNSVKEILNSYFETVSINSDYDAIPYNMRIEHTPTLIFLRADSEEPLMNLTGINALGEFLEVLEEVVNDGHNGGYLKL